jgi:hypothetical protein
MTESAVPVLQLKSGLTIQGPLAKLRKFCDNEHETYDAVPTAQDAIVTIHDILLSVMMNSHLDAKRARSVWLERAKLGAHLAKIPPALALDAPEAEIPWETIVAMFEEFEHTWGTKLAVGSKILHKKRPELIPIMDDVVRRYYERAYPDFEWNPKCGPLSGQLMRHFRDDLLAAKPQLEVLASELLAGGRSLTQVRLLEVLVWIETEPRGYYRRVA